MYVLIRNLIQGVQFSNEATSKSTGRLYPVFWRIIYVKHTGHCGSYVTTLERKQNVQSAEIILMSNGYTHCMFHSGLQCVIFLITCHTCSGQIFQLDLQTYRATYMCMYCILDIPTRETIHTTFRSMYNVYMHATPYLIC